MIDPLRRLARSRSTARITRILMHGEVEFSCLLTAWIGVTWGLYVLMPWSDMYQRERPTLYLMGNIVPENVWGALAVLVGLAQGAGLLWGDSRLIGWSAMAAFLLWMFVAWLYLLVDYTVPHNVVYGAVGIAAGWGYLRATVPRVLFDADMGPQQ